MRSPSLHLDDHPMTCKWLTSLPLWGLFPFQMTMLWLIKGGDPNHLRYLGTHPPSKTIPGAIFSGTSVSLLFPKRLSRRNTASPAWSPHGVLGFLRSTVILYKGLLKEGGSKERRGSLWEFGWVCGTWESGNQGIIDKNPIGKTKDPTPL